MATGKPLDAEWLGWLHTNRLRGCDPAVLYDKALAQGFAPAAISEALGGFRPLASRQWTPPGGNSPWAVLARAPLTDPAHEPRAWRLDTPLAQIYEIPALLSEQDCAALITAIDSSLAPSSVTRGPADYRTSRTCHLRHAAPQLVERIDGCLAALIGVDEAYSEPLQGQRYDPGQYFKAHTDWFAPGTEEYATHTRPGGQRTWTVMVYLNAVEAGGQTRFERIGRDVQPCPGLGLAWNNLDPEGRPNPATLHEALPVLRGRKYVITKWFRAETGRHHSPGSG